MICICISFVLAAHGRKISGVVVEKITGNPIPGVAVLLGEEYLWTVSDQAGRFSINDIQCGEYEMKLSILGFVDYTTKVDLRTKDVENLKVVMLESSLALDEVVVTAQRAKDGLSTSHQLGRDALNHLQMSSMSDISSLLPGGKTINPDLTRDNPFSLREGGTGVANAAFGTAVEVDGVRLNTNSGFDGMSGAGTRNVGVENIESVEVITGVPSAEYGDLNSGLVKIHTRKGRTPAHVVFSVNPRTYQVSASKGIDLQQERGVLNVSGEWARATAQLVSPYESYDRKGLTASYSNTFRKNIRFELGVAGNLGGMNSKDDPDASNGTYEKVKDNVFRANTSVVWMVNRPGITNLKLDASVNYQDKKSHLHLFRSSASARPAVHAEEEGYHLATLLPKGTYFEDAINDSKELDFSASAKYEWNRNWKDSKSRLKAGLQWKANGNVGEGKYYLEPDLAGDGYRPRPYSDYPFMHNLSVYAEERLDFPVGKTRLELMAGIRMENVFIKGTRYDNMSTFSPRLNVKWELGKHFSLCGGWGVTEKLPSFFILYPEQEYRDMSSFPFNTADGTPGYVYYTQPYKMLHNPQLKWQRNSNSELGIELHFGGFSLSLVGFYNMTRNPYLLRYQYEPLSYKIFRKPSKDYEVPEDAQFRYNEETGMIAFAPQGSAAWTDMALEVQDTTFVGNKIQANGTDIHRAGLELVAEFPEIRPIRTRFRLDASYSWSRYVNNDLAQNYQAGRSYLSAGAPLKNRSYQWVGIYAFGGGDRSGVSNGRVLHNLDANLTAITHIPQARIIITCKLEACLVKRSRNLSEYQGKEYAYNVSEKGTEATGGSIYDGNSYTAIRPVAYIDLEGKVHEFTDADAQDEQLKSLILKSSNKYIFAQDGYTPYFSANISITKEVGKHVSLSFFANNFTNSRMASRSLATGIRTIFTPSFYYGLTCRLKF